MALATTGTHSNRSKKRFPAWGSDWLFENTFDITAGADSLNLFQSTGVEKGAQLEVSEIRVLADAWARTARDKEQGRLLAAPAEV